MLTYTFVQNIKILAAPGSIANIGEVVGTAGYKKAMFIHGGSLRRSGVADSVKKSLAEHGVGCIGFEKVKSDPPASLVDEGADFARENGCDCVIAIGGGSAIDMGKAINMLRFNEGKVLEYLTKPHVHSPGLFVSPTTSGTGAELSTGSVITDTEHNMKLPLPVYNSMPEVAILDPELTASMPAAMTMQTGLDTFSHAIEGYCNVMSNMMMDPICEKILELVAENLPRRSRRRKQHSGSLAYAGRRMHERLDSHKCLRQCRSQSRPCRRCILSHCPRLRLLLRAASRTQAYGSGRSRQGQAHRYDTRRRI